MLEQAGEFLKLTGLDDQYTAFHCLLAVDALDHESLRERLRCDKYASPSSPTFVPVLRQSAIEDLDVFRVRESFVKLFVSRRFKTVYEKEGLTGLDFVPVPLI
jgi:hypothetical protein